MDTKEYRTIDKSDWGDGPWQDEPDKIQFTDEATGLPCLIVRVAWSGHLCGYVGLSEGHPAFGVEYSDVRRAAPDDDGDEWIDVHGGLTFSDLCQPGDGESRGICHVPGEGEPDHVWWLGFDCAHSGDLGPASAARNKDNPIFARHDWETYRTVGYVKHHCAKLAQQLAMVKP